MVPMAAGEPLIPRIERLFPVLDRHFQLAERLLHPLHRRFQRSEPSAAPPGDQNKQAEYAQSPFPSNIYDYHSGETR